MALSRDEVEDLIDSWELDPAVDTVAPAVQLLATMAVGDPGRIDVLQVIADHHAMRGEVDRALETLDRADGATGHETDVVAAMRISFMLEAGRPDDAQPLLTELRRRGSRLPSEAIERVADSLEQVGRLAEAVRWFTIALRDLDPLHDLPDRSEEYPLIRRMRVRQALDLLPDQYDELARELLEERRTR